MLTINFKKWNTIIGWIAFLIALAVYTITLEPTVSFWDSGEYIATSAKLEVGHPPGAPLFQMLGALASTFASSPDKIAAAVNMVSALSSAFAVLFMFWSATNILMKVVKIGTEKLSNNTVIAVLGSCLIGALTFTFSDTFWFSAVETEVYAMATFMLALLLWLGLRWIDAIDEPRGNKWLLLISLVIGMSFGVHFMALLAIPSIGYLYFFKKYPQVTVKNFIIANIVVVAILLVVFGFLLPYTMIFFGKSEIFFVNSIGLPFNAGSIIAFAIVVSLFVIGLKLTRQKQKQFANTLILSVMFIFIGFSCWLMLPIRANTQIPINENKPSDAAELLAYYNREQYGSRSLFYDTYFTIKYGAGDALDPSKPYKDGKPNYERDETSGKYIMVTDGKGSEPNYSSRFKGFLPRVWEPDMAVNYMTYTKPIDFKLKPEFASEPQLMEMASQLKAQVQSGRMSLREYDDILRQMGEYIDIDKPGFFDNMSFMFNYQFGYMYTRYLMWNFAGRQNDIQGYNDRMNGNWISGIKFLDEIRLGSQENLTSDMLNNKGRNVYYMLPFILGLVGFIFHYRKDPKTFYVLLALFLFTSFALKIFLNERPFEPRERDYAVVGSFMVFAMWVGYGVYAIYEFLSSKINAKIALPLVLGVTLLASPVLMASENWDDHDRSDKYTALALGRAYLDSLDKNAIIFTIGDNDTFPLWYLQEVEGYRTDVRVVCTTLLQAEWYIDQMKVKAHQSEPLKIRFNHKQYAGENMYYAAVAPTVDERFDLNTILEFIASDDPRGKMETERGTFLTRIPTNKFSLPVDKEKVLKNGTISQQYADEIVNEIPIDVKANALYRMRIIMYDIIANNNWDRPVYFTGGSITDEDFLWMKDYLQLNGLVYKLVPMKAERTYDMHPLYIGSIDTDKMYETVTNWYWGNFGSPNIYHDPETRKNSMNFRINLERLATQLVKEGKTEKAKKIVDLAIQNFPIEYYLPNDRTASYFAVEPFADLYYVLGEKHKAATLATKLFTKAEENLNFYKEMKLNEQREFGMDIINAFETAYRIIDNCKLHKDTATVAALTKRIAPFEKHFNRYLNAYKQQQEAEAEMMQQEQQMLRDSATQTVDSVKQ
ncbi:DUF2723 domain-containing protein [Paenimyroides aestuarii]|uniref:DUF2723 domain-containing protein n=1 Tax=Paenimyroides aestuarii TaxID=2968490 RepID=A0ABY5NW22_9FLAO|nr:DUF2723 domain-containing protein [Paenimyroides aestuarii]UUV22749.1 DUF2723 domain-containing protein [Paenimyroides aestuarii]